MTLGEREVAVRSSPSVTARREEPLDWVSALTLPGPEQEEALRSLHALLLRASHHQVRRMRGVLPDLGEDRVAELANEAADDAMMAVLAKLPTFEGRSRFTTWAYKFAILQCATAVRHYAWQHRDVELDDAVPHVASDPSPGDLAEADDLATAVRDAMIHVLTPHQRRVTVALLVDDVPIDVLAERLGTTRNALYKTLHDARVRLRAELIASGHLPAVGPGRP
ncbi:MAG TPA: sigma-70 family RNA polymerase sigma factor [Propionibacteriaceae bacterium]|nr:sigma-70 family RNA polymerase sigma factor [Propionibacteriaceae bacterium]